MPARVATSSAIPTRHPREVQVSDLIECPLWTVSDRQGRW